MNRETNLNRVAIIGCGKVGSTAAFSLHLNGAAEEIVLIDKNKNKAVGEAMDLRHAVPLLLSRPARIWAVIRTRRKPTLPLSRRAFTVFRAKHASDLLGRNISARLGR